MFGLRWLTNVFLRARLRDCALATGQAKKAIPASASAGGYLPYPAIGACETAQDAALEGAFDVQ